MATLAHQPHDEKKGCLQTVETREPEMIVIARDEETQAKIWTGEFKS